MAIVLIVCSIDLVVCRKENVDVYYRRMDIQTKKQRQLAGITDGMEERMRVSYYKEWRNYPVIQIRGVRHYTGASELVILSALVISTLLPIISS